MRNPMPLALLLLLHAVAGCHDANPGAADDQRAPAAIERPAVTTPATVPSVPASRASGADAGAATPAATLALDGEGLRIFMAETGASRAIPFGIAKADALAMLEAVQGAPPGDQGENVDCGATNAIWPDGLTVWFARDRFVGWSVASAASPLSTAGGLAVGTSRADLENGASVATIAPSSLGEEFTAGDVAGLLDSAGADARVSNLWAGEVCIAR